MSNANASNMINEVNDFLESFETRKDGDAFYICRNDFVDMQESDFEFFTDEDAAIIKDYFHIRPGLAHTFLPWASLEKYLKKIKPTNKPKYNIEIDW